MAGVVNNKAAAGSMLFQSLYQFAFSHNIPPHFLL